MYALTTQRHLLSHPLIYFFSGEPWQFPLIAEVLEGARATRYNYASKSDLSLTSLSFYSKSAATNTLTWNPNPTVVASYFRRPVLFAFGTIKLVDVTTSLWPSTLTSFSASCALPLLPRKWFSPHPSMLATSPSNLHSDVIRPQVEYVRMEFRLRYPRDVSEFLFQLLQLRI